MDFRKIAYEIAKKELFIYTLYNKIANIEKDINNSEILKKITEDEKKHYDFWQKISGNYNIKPNYFLIYFFLFLRRIFGLIFILKFFERNENYFIKKYEILIKEIPIEYKYELKNIIKNEKLHKKELLSKINDKIFEYISFFGLGFAHGLTEIIGVNTGFLGVAQSTFLVGIYGIMVAFSASLSIFYGAYVQAKHDVIKKPFFAGTAASLGHFISFVIISIPYLFIKSMFVAFLASLFVAIFIMSIYIFYTSITLDKSFKYEFLKLTSFMLVIAFISYWIGIFLRNLFKIS
jgi:VIT1/CCC1 family predicted Fe2+/Mn2+ transporter